MTEQPLAIWHSGVDSNGIPIKESIVTDAGNGMVNFIKTWDGPGSAPPTQFINPLLIDGEYYVKFFKQKKDGSEDKYHLFKICCPVINSDCDSPIEWSKKQIPGCVNNFTSDTCQKRFLTIKDPDVFNSLIRDI